MNKTRVGTECVIVVELHLSAEIPMQAPYVCVHYVDAPVQERATAVTFDKGAESKHNVPQEHDTAVF
jgi:hypothetical protein